MQSMDYENNKVRINNGKAKANEDGSYAVYLSHEPMDVDNWISTGGIKKPLYYVAGSWRRRCLNSLPLNFVSYNEHYLEVIEIENLK